MYLVGKKNEKLQVVACVEKTHDRESFAPCVTEVITSFLHHRDIQRGTAVNEERLSLRRILGELTRPWRFQIKRVRQDETGCFIKRSCGNQIANPLTRLVCDPFIDALRGYCRIGNEIDRLKRPAEILFHQ